MNRSEADRRRAIALQAFPPRWRDRHGDELVHVSGELASASEHDAGWREFFDIVRGGLSVRIEDRPPSRVRAGYHWLEKPVPPRWHSWMRDDLRGRWMGWRRNVRAMFPLWLIMVFVDASSSGANAGQPLLKGWVFLGVAVVLGPLQARRTRTRMNSKVGYDIVSVTLPPPGRVLSPTAAPRPVPRRPATRMSYVRSAVPFATWSMVSGAALVAGAALSNAANRSIGPVTFSPDPNSPLTAHQVAMIGQGVTIAVVAVAVVTAVVVGRRVRALARVTIHDTRTLSMRDTWLVASLLGAPATLIGALGVMPDLASAAIGASLVVAGTASTVAAVVVARRDLELGRRISLVELMIGDRDPAVRSESQRAGV